MHDEGDGGVHEDDTWDHQKAAILKFRLCEGDIIGKVIAGYKYMQCRNELQNIAIIANQNHPKVKNINSLLTMYT